MILKALCFSVFILGLTSCNSVKTKLVYSAVNGENKHSRALDFNDTTFVVGGQHGTVSFFEGKSNQIVDSIPGAEDIRDIKILRGGALILMNSGENGIIWRTSQGMTDPKQAYYEKGQFLDGMDFWNDKNGVAYGDPVDGKFVVLLTEDMGRSWFPIDYENIPYALPNEAGFAASGTGIAAVEESVIIFGTGMGDTARLFVSEDKGKNWNVKSTPLKSGESYGIYSLYFWSKHEGVIVGGSYLKPEDNENNCFYTLDGGDTWIKGGEGLGGYISCVHGTKDGEFMVATGRVGTYYSLNRGKTWNILFNKKFYSVRVSEDTLYFSGKEGVIEVYSYSLKSQN
ncbi:MAG: hypothetical protein H6582_08145 [Crocinitomicaceae bacterium]|nr:hypothetical protein [Crocinitomicaceae bacterium]